MLGVNAIREKEQRTESCGAPKFTNLLRDKKPAKEIEADFSKMIHWPSLKESMFIRIDVCLCYYNRGKL